MPRFLAALCLFLLAAGAAEARSLALVIGNDDYRNVPRLKKAVNDARAVSAELTRLGFAVRNTGGAIATVFGLLLVLPLLAQALPTSLEVHVNKYLPMIAGTAGMTTAHGTDQLAPWAGLGVFALYVVAALGVGLVLLRRRDA